MFTLASRDDKIDKIKYTLTKSTRWMTETKKQWLIAMLQALPNEKINKLDGILHDPKIESIGVELAEFTWEIQMEIEEEKYRTR